jgi:hypothetical protein
MIRTSRLLVALTLFAAMSVAVAAPSGAAAKGTSCKTQTGLATFKPGLTPTKKTVKLITTGAASKCTGGGVTSGKLTAPTTTLKNATCSSLSTLAKPINLTETIKWNTGKTSTLAGKTSVNKKNQNVYTAKVTKGLFAGLKVTLTSQLKNITGKCTAASPLTKVAAVNVGAFTIK